MHITNRKLEVVCGSMFSGKTEELIRRIKRAQIADQKVCVYKPAVDVRYGADRVVTHSKTDLETVTGIKPIPIASGQKLPIEDEVDVLAFDECQFFEEKWFLKLITEILLHPSRDDVSKFPDRIICAGLDMDSFGNPFGVMPSLLAMADEVTKLKSVCVVCKRDASRTFRKTSNTERNLIGGIEAYEPRCLSCWAII